MTSGPEIALRYEDLGPGHPAGLWLLFDVRLRNDADGPRWFILPSHAVSDDASPFSVIAIEVWRLNARASIPHLQFVGSSGFQAWLLPAHGALRIRHLPIVWFGDPPHGAVTLRCAIAEDIEIEREPVVQWLGSQVMSPASADADYDERDLVASRIATSRTEQPVQLRSVRTIDVTTEVTLGKSR